MWPQSRRPHGRVCCRGRPGVCWPCKLSQVPCAHLVAEFARPARGGNGGGACTCTPRRTNCCYRSISCEKQSLHRSPTHSNQWCACRGACPHMREGIGACRCGRWAGVKCRGKGGNAGKSPRVKLHNCITCAYGGFVTPRSAPPASPVRSARWLGTPDIARVSYTHHNKT